VEAKVKKLEDEIKEYFLDKKIRMIKQSANNHIDKFRDYHHELISLMPWLGPYITTRINHDDALQMIKCATLPVTIKGGYFTRKVMDDQMKPYTGGMAT